MMAGEKEKLKQKRYNEFYMDVAYRVSQMSYAERLKVGSILVKDGNIISFGWNGMPSGWTNECEDVVTPTLSYLQGDESTLRTKDEVLHSEQNLLMKLAKSTNSSEDADMFVTHAPCIHCAKLIHQSGIRKVFYRNEYRDDGGLKFLEKCGVQIEKV
jgi:dCMP deaminase